jgi:hypothetical protein
MKGYIVIESCDDYEQILCLQKGFDVPDEGILCWSGEGFQRHIFSSRSSARSAINRTHHYSMAYGLTNKPEKALCKVVPIELAAEFTPQPKT